MPYVKGDNPSNLHLEMLTLIAPALDFDVQVHYPHLPEQGGILSSFLCENRAAGFR